MQIGVQRLPSTQEVISRTKEKFKASLPVYEVIIRFKNLMYTPTTEAAEQR